MKNCFHWTDLGFKKLLSMERPLLRPDEDGVIDVSYSVLGEIGETYRLPCGIDGAFSHPFLEFDATNSRITRIQNLEGCTSLRRLVLRQNAIAKISGLETLTELEEIDLYLNHVQELNGLENKSKLKRLDLSFNRIRSMESLSRFALPALEELYLVQNRIREIAGLRAENLPQLKLLELGSNRIAAIGENIEQVGASLEELWLGRNKIRQVPLLRGMHRLRRVSVQSNHLLEIGSGFEPSADALEELYLSHNGISSLAGVETLAKLKLLDLGCNRIVQLDHFLEELKNLEELWLNGNLVETLDQVYKLSGHSQLRTLYLEGNPVADWLTREHGQEWYRAVVVSILPMLTQLDADPVTEETRSLSDSEHCEAIRDRER